MFQRWITLTHRRLAFWICLAVVLTLALIPPSPYVPTLWWDKANHALAFAVLAVLGSCSYPGRTSAVLLGLLGYGVLIELLQALTPYRTAEFADVLADAVGLVLGSQLVRLLQQLQKYAGARKRGGG